MAFNCSTWSCLEELRPLDFRTSLNKYCNMLRTAAVSPVAQSLWECFVVVFDKLLP